MELLRSWSKNGKILFVVVEKSRGCREKSKQNKSKTEMLFKRRDKENHIFLFIGKKQKRRNDASIGNGEMMQQVFLDDLKECRRYQIGFFISSGVAIKFLFQL
jgi:hypothetical protein